MQWCLKKKKEKYSSLIFQVIEETLTSQKRTEEEKSMGNNYVRKKPQNQGFVRFSNFSIPEQLEKLPTRCSETQ